MFDDITTELFLIGTHVVSGALLQTMANSD